MMGRRLLVCRWRLIWLLLLRVFGLAVRSSVRVLRRRRGIVRLLGLAVGCAVSFPTTARSVVVLQRCALVSSPLSDQPCTATTHLVSPSLAPAALVFPLTTTASPSSSTTTTFSPVASVPSTPIVTPGPASAVLVGLALLPTVAILSRWWRAVIAVEQ